MAMRDPGPPGRNPFFDHGPEAFDDAFPAEPGDAGLGDAGLGGPDDARDSDAGRGAGADPWTHAVGVDPLGTLAGLVDALQHAQPEAAEHLVAAAHELVLAVKCVVDATEAVLAAQRAEPRESDTPDEPEAPPRSGGVRRIDLA